MRISFADGALDPLSEAQWRRALGQILEAVRAADLTVAATYRGLTVRLEPDQGAPSDVKSRSVALRKLLGVLVQANVVWLRQHPGTPHPYRAGIRYVREAAGSEEWQGIAQVLQARGGDCEDLSAYLCAWHVVRDGRCAVRLLWRTFDELGEDGHTTWHVQTKLASGQVEDPSKRLGMEGEA